MENVGKSAQDLHGTIVKAVQAEESRGKHKDVRDRLFRELSPYGQYINPLAILSSEVYGLNLPQLETAEVLEHVTSTPSILSRDYKSYICSKGQEARTHELCFFKPLQSLLLKSIFKICKLFNGYLLRRETLY